MYIIFIQVDIGDQLIKLNGDELSELPPAECKLVFFTYMYLIRHGSLPKSLYSAVLLLHPR